MLNSVESQNHLFVDYKNDKQIYEMIAKADLNVSEADHQKNIDIKIVKEIFDYPVPTYS